MREDDELRSNVDESKVETIKFHKAYAPYKIRNREKSILGKQKLISKCIRKN